MISLPPQTSQIVISPGYMAEIKFFVSVEVIAETEGEKARKDRRPMKNKSHGHRK